LTHIDCRNPKDKSVTVWRQGVPSPLDPTVEPVAPAKASIAQVNRSAVQAEVRKATERAAEPPPQSGRQGTQFPANVSDVINRRPGAFVTREDGTAVVTTPEGDNLILSPAEILQNRDQVDLQAAKIEELEQQVEDLLGQQAAGSTPILKVPQHCAITEVHRVAGPHRRGRPHRGPAR
jgi:hypothetical protein